MQHCRGMLFLKPSCIHCSTLVIDASCQVSLKSVNQFRRRFLKGFYHYMGLAAILVM